MSPLPPSHPPLWIRIWSTLWQIAYTLLHPLHPWLPTAIQRFILRPCLPDTLPGLQDLRRQHTHCLFFYCSSAGEYEQALPILARLPNTVLGIVIFFSESGVRYHQNRKDTVPYLLAPPGDILSHWAPIFSALSPCGSLIIRHELWPSFLSVAGGYGEAWLLNASLSEAVKHSWWQKWWKRKLFTQIQRIYTVDDTEKTQFRYALGIPSDKIASVMGDTKFDRVFERAVQATTEDLTQWKKDHLPDRWMCILGSAWESDVEIALESQEQQLLRKGSAQAYYLIIVLHDPTPERLQWVEAKAQAKNLRTVRYSQMTEPQGNSDILLVDRMGMLAELYQLADCALVGGAFHHKVHNVLEPGCRGLAVAFGPRYHNSHEACKLVAAGLATVCHNRVDFLQWIQNAPLLQKKGKDTRTFLTSLQGTADKITHDLLWHIERERPHMPS